MYQPLNTPVAMKMREMSDLLQQKSASPFRINAYLRAGQILLGLQRQVSDILQQQGVNGLMELPSVGRGIATAISEFVTTGRWSQLDRLRGTLVTKTHGPLLGRRVVRGMEQACSRYYRAMAPAG